MTALSRYADANACGTCRKAVESGESVVHEECAARAALLLAPDQLDYESLLDLSDDERRALPARFHTPQFDSLGTPNAWLCAVCWGDGWVTRWPCATAQECGEQVFTHQAFLGDSVTESAVLRARVTTLSDQLAGAGLSLFEEEQENARLLAERQSTNAAVAEAHMSLRVQRDRVSELPDRLAAVLTERFTALGNPFSEMRAQFQGPDGWPASKPVGPQDVAEVLRELLTEVTP